MRHQVASPRFLLWAFWGHSLVRPPHLEGSSFRQSPQEKERVGWGFCRPLKLSAKYNVAGRGCKVLLRFSKISETFKPLRTPTLGPALYGGETWWDRVLSTKLGEAMPSFWALVPEPRLRPPVTIHPVLAATSAIPGSIPPPALQASTLARMSGVTVPPPPPRSPEHRQPVQEGLSRGRKSPHLSAVAGGVSPAGSPSQPAQPDRLRAVRGGEQSLASWHGQH